MKHLLIGLPLLALCLSGCSGSGDTPPDILCTTTIVADVVRQVSGGHQKIAVLMDADVDPHTYDPTPADAKALRGAKVVFYSGLHLEGKLTELLEDLASKKPVHALADDLPRQRKDDKGKADPHVWFDLELWANTADVAADALTKYDPAHAADYKANAKKYKDKLLAVHQEIKIELATIPKERRVLVTAHDAFEYFGRAYDIEVKAVQGISTESKAGVKEVRDLVSFLTERKIKAIFVETSVSPKNVEALKEGCEQAGHKIVIGGTLYSDSLGKLDSLTGTLEGTMRHNVKTIVEALR